MNFHKYVAAGNDFILFNGINKDYGNHNELALKVCSRHFGIGADGMMIVESSRVADVKMLYYNSDGSQGEMCGNGIRAFSKYIYDYNIVENKNISIETLAGIKYIDIITDELNKADRIKVDMGYPIFEGEKIPININKEKVIEEIIVINGKDYRFSALTVGVPHVVIFIEDIDKININDLGKKIETHPLFPKKANVNFVKVIDKDNINIYTWERGAGRTLGCGTGSCASVVIGNIIGNLNNKVNVNTEGGKLIIELNKDYKIFMIGDAIHIAKGEFIKR
ncbi:diaminopimelate epimerase [Tissierella pigra]|uniref:Diaminopimelate epimerase n=1 Tax=Tissierella pigra TaxID=2607614 RepID=A0A6N7XHQ5_9FIRM|nr:diaminopimelate epimerase [Tissierella pigra]MBU5427513.1 diaminopimelate epimerase [Tissierella pigra]MSU00262.1 diaminopimelate epimerase [Tissierella pigra]